ncbi:MAG TPA: DNA mismatch repair protein MutS, partial [Usitatibacter sp.]|nr:DNA mismatch repair protein MutS [Usitatibacter sp.]
MRREKGKGGEDEVFREAMRGVAPMPPSGRIEPRHSPAPPIPRKREEDERAVLEELARFTLDDECELEDDGSFLRPGLPRDILRKLRRTHWVIQDHLDLHGLTGAEAAAETGLFLAEARRRGLR